MATFADSDSQRYANKAILAPMVRVGTLPMRMLALKYGADLVYTPEIIDKRIINATRRVNPETGIIEYITNGVTDLQIHPKEKPFLVFQMGTSDPEIALQAALAVQQDVSGIDVNCGCPKKFSIQGGMGAALLTNPARLKAILETLVAHCSVPVTCKIRLLDTDPDTLDLVRMIESTGVKALAVHCRTRDERPAQPAHWDRLKPIVDAVTTIPVIVNGDVFRYEDIARAKEITGASSVMIARGAQSNPSVFCSQGPANSHLVAQQYVAIALAIHNRFQNTKYTLMQMYPYTKSKEYQLLTRAKTNEALKVIFDLDEPFSVTVDQLRFCTVKDICRDAADHAMVKPDHAPQPKPARPRSPAEPSNVGPPTKQAKVAI
ncbi:tRNA-dihydrouridine synthase 2 [Dimargaris verticillata]|uniref:tRNA-dihydrouridine synthase 2 n=1 Tax=Dimargaris verticillata TaxID=2761393 RepID=A0A9W8B5T7_9FUNG|nr:tRNA-dihydrouridine synthase 2 [Dimargaris verticillata]